MERVRIERWLLGRSGGTSRDLPQLDGLRGIAVLMVFLTHAWSFSGSPKYSFGGNDGAGLSTVLSMFNTGVDLFFVLSGFLIARRFMMAAEKGQPRPPLRRYGRDRFYRIAPLYWLVLAFVPLLMTPWLIKEDRVYSMDGLAALLSYIPMLSALFPWSFGQFFAISPVWTLTVEVLFYCLVPFVAVLFARRRWTATLPISLLVSLGWLAFLRTGPGSDLSTWFGSIGSPALPGRDFGRILLSTQLPTFAFAFGAGLSIAAIVSHREATEATAPPAGARWLVPGGLVLTLTLLITLGEIKQRQGLSDPFLLMRTKEAGGLVFYFAQHLAPVIGFGLILAGLVLDGRHHRIIGASPLRIIGILGYGFYLFHFPVLFSQTGLSWIRDIEPAWRFPVATAFSGITVLVLSAITWFAVERPMIERGKRVVTATLPDLADAQLRPDPARPGDPVEPSDSMPLLSGDPGKDQRPAARQAAPTQVITAMPVDEVDPPGWWTTPRGRRGLIGGIVVAAVLVGGLGWFFTRPPQVVVADVTGFEVAKAINDLADFEVEQIVVADDAIPAGSVVRTEPTAGTSAASGSVITVFVSIGPEPRVLPELNGLTIDEAQAKLLELGLVAVVGAPSFNEVVEEGRVLSWAVVGSPTLTAGDTVLKGASVELVVSAGRAPRAVPDLTNLGYAAAEATLKALDLVVQRADDVFSDTVPAGSVAGQDPAPGTELTPGSTVIVSISKGPDQVEFPDLAGLTAEQMVKTLQDLGFVVKTGGDTSKPLAYSAIDGAIVGVGSKVERGAEVVLVFES